MNCKMSVANSQYVLRAPEPCYQFKLESSESPLLIDVCYSPH